MIVIGQRPFCSLAIKMLDGKVNDGQLHRSTNSPIKKMNTYTLINTHSDFHHCPYLSKLLRCAPLRPAPARNSVFFFPKRLAVAPCLLARDPFTYVRVGPLKDASRVVRVLWCDEAIRTMGSRT